MNIKKCILLVLLMPSEVNHSFDAQEKKEFSTSTFCVSGIMPFSEPLEAYVPDPNSESDYRCFPMNGSYHVFNGLLWLSPINSIGCSFPCSARCGLCPLSSGHSHLHVCLSSIWTDNALYLQIISYPLPIVWGTEGQMWSHWPVHTACSLRL